MRIMLRSDSSPDVMISLNSECIKNNTWELCPVELLDQHIRTLQTARRWLLEQQAKKATNQ